MKKLFFLAILANTLFASCSLSKPEKKDAPFTGSIDLDNIDSVPIEKQEANIVRLDEALQSEKNMELVTQDDQAIEMDSIYDDAPTYAQVEEEAIAKAAPIRQVAQDDEVADQSAIISEPSMAEYIVQKEDTLILIAYKLYGDIKKWRELARLNKVHGHLKVGQPLQYKLAENLFQSPEGQAYLILRGDTMLRISENIYQKRNFWRHIYVHNKPLIYDPNILFAGATLYYLPPEKMVQRYGRRPAVAGF